MGGEKMTKRERDEMVLRRWLRKSNAANEAYYVAWLSSWQNRLRCLYRADQVTTRAALEPRDER